VIELNIFTVLIGLVMIIIGPASGIWSGLKINTVTQRLDLLVKGWDEDRADTRSWLNNLQEKTEDNTKHIGEVKAVMEDRKDR